MRRTFPEADIYPMYGLTEAFRSTFLDPALVADHPTSMGRAIPHAEILVCRPDGSVTSDDEPGELVHTRSEEHTSELQSLMRTSYAVFCLKQKNTSTKKRTQTC